MPEALARTLLAFLALHGLAGLFFAVRFLPARIGRVDPAARGSGWGFRLLILPGVVALWPLLWLRTRGAP